MFDNMGHEYVYDDEMIKESPWNPFLNILDSDDSLMHVFNANGYL